MEIVADITPREVSVPDDLVDAMAGDPTAAALFGSPARTQRKEWVRWILAAKQAEPRSSRIAKTVASLQAGKCSR